MTKNKTASTKDSTAKGAKNNPVGMPENGPSHAPWLKFYDPGVPANIQPIPAPIYYWLDQAAQKRPEATAISFKSYKINYRQLRLAAEILAANLHRHGVGKGDRVAVMMPNLPQTIMAFWGIVKAGATAVMTNPLYMGHELLYQLNDAEAKILLTTDTCWGKISELRRELCVKKYFITSPSDPLRLPADPLWRFRKRGGCAQVAEIDYKTVWPFADLFRGNRRLSHPIEHPEKDLAILQYTGGTTGIPKGAMLTHLNLMSNVQQLYEILRPILDKPQRFLGVLPFFHVYALNICVILPSASQAAVYCTPMFNPVETMQIIERQKITIFPGAPAVYIALLQHKEIKHYDFSSLLLCLSGSAPMPVEYIRLFSEKTRCTILEGYGLTEASPVTNINPLFGTRKPGTVGMPLPGTEARIVDMELGSIPMPANHVGELIIKGPQVMPGYWKQPDETANMLRNGWLYTGDIASMDEQGYVTIVDRKKDLVLTGGYNVYPREVDEVLHTHPKIKEAVSAGIPHGIRGEILKAYVVLKDGEQATPTEIMAFCRGKLANYKIPKQVEIRNDLPKNLVGKILRRALRAEEEQRRKETEASGAAKRRL